MIRKIHSLFGIIPIGIFLIVHLLLNSTVLNGSGVGSYPVIVNIMKGGGAYINILELVIIAAPLLIHGLYGLYIVYIAKNNALQYTYYRNWAFYLQRITALITFAFLIWHVWHLRLSFEEPKDIINQMIAILQNPLYFALYVIGVVSAAFHFANGKATFAMTWGLTVGPKSQNFMTLVSLGTFVLLSVLGIAILYKFSIATPVTVAFLTGGAF